MKTKLTLFVAVLAVALFGMGCASTLDEGLVAYYPFNGDANDATGNKLHGFLEGPTPTANRFGKPNQAIAFDGKDDGVSLPNQLFNKLDAFTYSTWLNLDISDKSQTILSLANKNEQNALTILLEDAKFRLWFRQEVRASLSVSPVSFVKQWKQIVVTRGASSATFKVYINGVQKSNLTFSKNVAVVVDPRGAWLGQEQDSVGGGFEVRQAFHGSMDDVRIYNRALSGAEVKSLYDLEKPKGK
jgi:hypothetical protein